MSDGFTYIASLSGGKDSTAMALHLMELGIEFEPVFFDTGWEHPAVYDYIENILPGVIGKPIRVLEGRVYDLTPELEEIALGFEKRLGRRSAMIRLCLHKGMFPSRRGRWCTQSLKIDALKKALKGAELVVNCVGIRAGESEARSKMPEREISTSLDCMVWRPLIAWSKADVIAIHKRHGVVPNRLYLQGAERVGCWPCIFSRKSEIRFMADNDPGRIDLLEDLENVICRLAEERYAARGETLESLGYHRPTWFGGQKGGTLNQPIRACVEWSQTRRGGKQTTLFREDEIVPGCVEWGLCDTGSIHG